MTQLPEVTVGSSKDWDVQAWLGLRKQGCVLLRGLYDPGFIDACRRQSDAILAYFNGEANSTLSPEDLHALERKAFQIRHLVIDQVAAAETLSAPLMSTASMALGKPCAVNGLSFIRRVDPTDTEDSGGHKLPFHQDQKILKSTLVNAWIPFRDAGLDAPGLEVVAKRLTGNEPTTSHEKHVYGEMGVEIEADHVLKTYGSDLIAPVVYAGDALLFYGATIHRTYISPTMTQSRTSVDMRFLARS